MNKQVQNISQVTADSSSSKRMPALAVLYFTCSGSNFLNLIVYESVPVYNGRYEEKPAA
jgi:hypothetical protein